MMTWLRDFSELSPEQKKIVRMPLPGRCLVTGPPGSGKTQTLVHRAAYLIKNQKISPERIRLFVLNDILETMLRQEMKRIDLPEKIVVLFDRWCRSFFLRHVSNDLPRIYVNGRIDDEKTRLGVLETLRRKKDLRGCISYALVDDGEDLNPEAMEILHLAAENITVTTALHQKSCKKTSSDSLADAALNLCKKNALLSRDFRSSIAIARLASFFIENTNGRKEYLSQAHNDQKEFPSSLFYMAPSEEKELDQLSRYIQLRQVKEENIGILLPTNGLVHRLTKELEERGILLEKAIPMDAQNVIHTPYDFRNNTPKITTYHFAKGLSFDSVLMPFLTAKTLSDIPVDQRLRQLFIGMVRASRWIYLSTVRGEECEEIQLLKSAEKEGHLTIFR